jgi:hypothetical protein
MVIILVGQDTDQDYISALYECIPFSFDISLNILFNN